VVRNAHARTAPPREDRRAITAPTLVITGDEDFICGPVCAQEICAGVKGARMSVVGDAGHQLFVEQPQAFHDEVADFLGA
jgi:proline iminopeptidase